MRRMLNYYVNTGGKWIPDRCGGGSNFIVFTCSRAAVRYFKAKPGRQLDVRGKIGRKRVRACWKAWNNGKIIAYVIKELPVL